MVNKGETSEPRSADRAAELWVPPSAGAIERVQMPHQHRILRERNSISNVRSTRGDELAHSLAEVWRMARPGP